MSAASFPGNRKHAVEEENIVQAPLPLASWFSLKTPRKLFAVGKAYIMLKSMRKQCRDHKNAVKSCLQIVTRHKFSLCRLMHETSHWKKSGKLMDWARRPSVECTSSSETTMNPLIKTLFHQTWLTTVLTSEQEKHNFRAPDYCSEKGLKALYIVRYSSDIIGRTTEWEIRVAFWW